MSTKAKTAIEAAMARIGCPPGDNADADLYRELQAALSDLRAQGEGDPVSSAPAPSCAMSRVDLKASADRYVMEQTGSHPDWTAGARLSKHLVSFVEWLSPSKEPETHIGKLVEAGKVLQDIANTCYATHGHTNGTRDAITAAIRAWDSARSSAPKEPASSPEGATDGE